MSSAIPGEEIYDECVKHLRQLSTETLQKGGDTFVEYGFEKGQCHNTCLLACMAGVQGQKQHSWMIEKILMEKQPGTTIDFWDDLSWAHHVAPEILFHALCDVLHER